ncbi:MAG: DegT/DnrJ/EryC1/StrS family aminotransferase [Verrucomicrobia bacterium]|nr:DegT/DnrJ/EryC1/StrS family aminotransferase [Verrucomicrobiota bacterium]
MERIPVFKPLIRQAEINAAVAALEMGWLGMGRYVGDFEAAVRQFIGVEDRFTVALSTGHAALHLALILAGVSRGDEVITPAFNNIADFQAIRAVGAEPVFCDIDEVTLCIDLARAAELISPRTKAMIVMDYDCVLCDHDAAQELAHARGIRLVHDAAHSFGGKYKGRTIGSFSDICMFSFDPVKTITCIDGGMLVVRSAEEAERLHEMRLIGMGQPVSVMYENRRAWTYDVRGPGFRYHMANLHAAIGLQQLASLQTISENRQKLGRRYNDALSRLPQVVVPATDFTDITPFLYYIRVPAEERDALRAHLTDKGIDTGIHWQPGHWFSYFKDCRRGDLSVTDRVGHQILSLPLHSDMCDELQVRVIEGVVSYFRS